MNGLKKTLKHRVIRIEGNGLFVLDGAPYKLEIGPTKNLHVFLNSPYDMRMVMIWFDDHYNRILQKRLNLKPLAKDMREFWGVVDKIEKGDSSLDFRRREIHKGLADKIRDMVQNPKSDEFRPSHLTGVVEMTEQQQMDLASIALSLYKTEVLERKD